MEAKRSPTLELAKSLGLVPPEPATCEVCDGTERPIIRWNGTEAHEDCLPGHWRKDRAELEAYMAEVHDRANR